MRHMHGTPQPHHRRPRTIKWRTSTDALAEQLARDKGFAGGVSELLERLVVAEANRKRGIAHLDPIAIHAATVAKSTARRVKIASCNLVRTSQAE